MSTDARQMLAHFDRAKQEIALCATIAEAKQFRDKVDAVRHFAKLSKDRELVDRATEFRLRAERRMGELLAEMEERGEKATQAKGRPSKASGATTLPKLGLSRDEAARAKKLAGSTETSFERAIETAKKAGELSDKVVIREATKRDAERKQKLGEWPFRGTWTEEEIDEAEKWFRSVPKGQALKRRMAEAGCGPRQVLRAARHCSGASHEYLEEAVSAALANGAGDAAMLYGEEPPCDGLAIQIAKTISEFEPYPDERRKRIVIHALREADEISEQLRQQEARRWKRLYSERATA